MTLQSQDNLQDSLKIVEKNLTDLEVDKQSWCSSLEKNDRMRLTIISIDGAVICDNFAINKKLDNHLYRPEVQAALTSNFGLAARYSDSAKMDMVYVAKLIKQTTGEELILRLSTPTKNIDQAMTKLDSSIFLFIFPLFFITTLMSLYASLQVSSPLTSIFEKVEKMKRVRKKSNQSATGIEDSGEAVDTDEWEILERTLDTAKNDLENYIGELFVENEKINTLMESISDCILAINKNHTILFANGQFKKNFLPREHSNKEMKEYKFWEVVRDPDVHDLFSEVLEKEEFRKSRNHLFTVKEGKVQAYYDLTISPLKNTDGTTMGAVCVFHNVTDRKTAEQLREDFVANVSHEVRTPLTALKGYIQMLANFLDEKDIPERENWEIFSKRIEWNADRLTHLFNDILQLSVIESKRKIEKEIISIEDVTTHTIANLKQSYENKKISIKTSFDVSEVFAHAQLLEQVLTNLLDNALKYSPAGSLIEIKWSQDSKHTILCVCDNGESISEKHHARLFERFYRVDPSRSREQGGTGLGLAIVKHIVQKHLGSVHYEKPAEGGNRFIVKLPLSFNKFLNS